MTAIVVTLVVLALALAVAAVATTRRRTAGIVATTTVATVAVAVVALAAGQVGAALAVLLIAAATAAVAAAFVVLQGVLSAGRRRARCGPEALLGHVGVVRRSLDPVGQILVNGELWRARRSWAEEDEPPPRPGEAVVVDHVQGLTLSVRRAEIWEVER